MIPRCDAPQILIFLLVFTSVGTICFADNTPDKFLFFEGAAHFYFAPEMFSDTVQPKTGVRGALGWGWRRLRFSFASGYTRITGTNPLVRDSTFIPLTFRLGYGQPLGQIFSIRLDLGGGILFSQANLYTSALDNYMGMPTVNKSETNGMAEARLSAVFTLPGNFLQISAGGNGYLLPETGGTLFRGAFEAGLVLKIAKRRIEVDPPVPQEPPPLPSEPEEPVDEHEKPPGQREGSRR
jgi:hypothetical protein